MKRLLLVFVLLTVPVFAQEKQVVGAPVKAAPMPKLDTPKIETPKQITDENRRALAVLQQKASGFQEAILVLQKEQDSLAGQWSRLVQSLQVEGYNLDLSSGVYTKKEEKK